MKKLMMMLATAFAAAMPLMATVMVSPDVVVGEWTSNFVSAKEYADTNAVPMLVYWTNPGCSHCKKLEDVFETEEFRAWQHDRQMVMVFSSGDATVKAFAKNDSREYPYVAVYWNKGDGNVVLEKFTGRTGRMPWRSGTLLLQFKCSVDSALGLDPELPPFLVEDGELTFVNLNGLTEFVIPDGTTSIGSRVFYGCTNLMSVTIPNSVTNIGDSAFSGCSGLTSVTIPGSVISIGYDAFYGCEGVRDFIVDEANRNYKSSNGFLLTADGASILYAPIGKSEIVIPKGVVSIDDYAFSGCKGLTSVTISDGVTSIGYAAFLGCSGLTGVTIPDSVTSIGSWAFEYCSSLTSVTIPDSVMSIGDGAFSWCSGLADENGFVIVRNVLYNYYGSGGNVLIPDGVTSIGDYAFSGCSELTSVTIPNSVTSIGLCAFEGCNGLTSVTIPASVKAIGTCLFFDFEQGALTSLVLPTWCKNAKVDDWDMFLSEVGRSLSDSEFRRYLFGCVCKDSPYCVQAAARVKITFKDVWNGGASGGSVGGGVAEIWKKARTLYGALVDKHSGDVKGVIQVKVGKANKKGQVSISGTITGLDGRKRSAKGGKVTVSGSSASTTLNVRNGTSATITVNAHAISGSWNGCMIESAVIGGEVWKTAYFNLDDVPDGYDIEVAGHAYYVESWPNDEPVEMRGRKWYCQKAGRMKWLGPCCLSGFQTCLCCDSCCGWVPIGDTNYNGLKLSYNMNTGVFKGSFNLYMTEKRNNDSDKGVKKTVNVSGVLVDGIGYGLATLRGFGSWSLTIR